jgi:hypothetical protein
MAANRSTKFIIDEDFDNRILRGLLRRQSNLDMIRVQDVGLASADDIIILEWAAQEGRILLTHDVNTMTYHAYERVSVEKPMAGVIIVPQSLAIGTAIEDILIVAECTSPAEWQAQILYLPL